LKNDWAAAGTCRKKSVNTPKAISFLADLLISAPLNM
jgi:hypothetical protein